MWFKLHKFQVLTRISRGNKKCRNLSTLQEQQDLDAMEKNIIMRQHYNNMPKIRNLLEQLKSMQENEATNLKTQLAVELNKLPNLTHQRLWDYGEQPKELLRYNPNEIAENTMTTFKEFSEICKKLNLLRMEHLGNFTGHKSYYLLGALAMLEQALINFAVNKLEKFHFSLMSVPDLLPSSIIEGCGMQTEGERTQVYKLDSGLCLSGTAEMSLAGYFSNKEFTEAELPIKVCAVSRCFRAETSGLQDEKGIYRVHQFTKVEMFALCSADNNASSDLLESFKDIEMSLFRDLELNYRVLDMPPMELGAPAYQKYDIETWMPGRKMWGEISSCSNCTDYQAKRLNIRYRREKDGQLRYVHTINGTAAAIPRLLIGIIESNQQNNGESILIPNVLRSYMKSDIITKDKRIPELKLVKHIKPKPVK